MLINSALGGVAAAVGVAAVGVAWSVGAGQK